MKSIKVKPQKPTPRLRRLLTRAHIIFKREYPGLDVVIEYMFLKSEDIQLLCRKFGKGGRFAVSTCDRYERRVIFDIDLDKTPDDFVLFQFLHELIHAGFGGTCEAKAISMTFDVMKKLGIGHDDFMRRYRQLLVSI